LERDYSIVHKHKEYSQEWHKWKFINSCTFFLVILPIFGFGTLLINLVFYYILFEGLLNRIVLKKGFFYVGHTAATDIRIQNVVAFLNKFMLFKRLTTPAFSAFIKITSLILAIYFFI